MFVVHKDGSQASEDLGPTILYSI